MPRSYWIIHAQVHQAEWQWQHPKGLNMQQVAESRMYAKNLPCHGRQRSAATPRKKGAAELDFVKLADFQTHATPIAR